MKDLKENYLYRSQHPTLGGGFFYIPERRLRVIASNGFGWDHVSVSLEDRAPTWEEMDFIKRMFFKDDETVIQIHPPIKDYINRMPYCLHLWRPQKEVIPIPPQWMV